MNFIAKMQQSEKRNRAEASKNICGGMYGKNVFCAVNSEGLTAFQGESDSSRRKCPMWARKRKAFTLAETLIVIAIIGIIASIVTPMLFGTTSDAELKAAWKKAYSDLSQATMMIVADNGGTLAGAFPGDALGSEDFKNAFASKLNIIKDCSGTSNHGGSGTGVSAEGCWHSGTNSWYFLNGNGLGSYTNPGLILNNGSLINFYINKSDCSYTVGDYTRCGDIYVDVNGFKKPNTIGKDIFHANVTSTALIPTGARNYHSPSTTCIESSTATTNKGYGCSAKYLYE
ncbi:MAG: prepilin-type N-terminal cleavage/methylation domain-containing protein [Candidatus Gastranaerophilales bacterium]|nr:prepilin-type N-terminal cleavage/methylation domain-containing protein [Candidatus Gastranaerophilales bacterium]